MSNEVSLGERELNLFEVPISSTVEEINCDVISKNSNLFNSVDDKENTNMNDDEELIQEDDENLPIGGGHAFQGPLVSQ